MQTVSQELFNQLSHLRPGDIIRLARRTRGHLDDAQILAGVDTVPVVYQVGTERITSIALRPDGVLDMGVATSGLNDTLVTNWGCAFYRVVDDTRPVSPYGLQSFETVMRDTRDPRSPAASWQPQPGDTAYDLMC